MLVSGMGILNGSFERW